MNLFSPKVQLLVNKLIFQNKILDSIENACFFLGEAFWGIKLKFILKIIVVLVQVFNFCLQQVHIQKYKDRQKFYDHPFN